MEIKSLQRELQNNAYPGRGIVIGRTSNRKYAVNAYFIMGRSVNSRNRIFVEEGEGIRTEAFDPSQLSDPSLIIYAPVRVLGRRTIVTNGDQTDTIYDGLAAGKSFEEALAAREFEPDAPNYTPRISGLMELAEGAFSYKMSILKSADGDPSCCCRYTFSYDKPLAGEGRFIHTYQQDGDPLPSFQGEPTRIAVGGEDIDSFAKGIWESLDAENKVSLFVRYIEIETGRYESRIINKNV
ncbi:inosine monophosphate cyclohydrolase [bacterium 1XD8-76]|nr:inosine monophosphate cyclohydrolase [bacterium 1XD8-76]